MSFAASRLAIVIALMAAVCLSIGGLANPPSAAASSQRDRIVRIVESHIGAPYRFGAEGPKAFDCSGLVYRVFQQAGLANKISGVRRGAKGYLHWFKKRGLAGRYNPKPGDLVIWNKGHHIGIYVGNGRAVSALNKRYGVRKHGIGFVHTFTTYLHVKLHGAVAADPPPSTQTPETVTATASRLNVRNGPGTSHARVATVDRGTVITVTDKSTDAKGRDWIEGTLPSGRSGWVAGWLVESTQ